MRGFDARCGWVAAARRAADVELESPRDHDHGLRPVAVLEHGKLESFGAVHEQATAKTFLILHDPVAAAVPADTEHARQRGRAPRGRVELAHDSLLQDA